MYASAAFVGRKGFELIGLTEIRGEVDVPETFYRRGESGLEHQAKVAFLYILFANNFPRPFGRSSFSDLAMLTMDMVLLSHDIGEIEIGDIPDDGNPLHAQKDEAEMKVFINLMQTGFNKYGGKMGEGYFRAFQKCNNTLGQIMYALDKLEAVLTQIYFEQYEIYGTITAKPYPTELDNYFMRITGTPSAVDCWAAHMKSRINNFPDSVRDPIYAVLEVAIRDVRGEMFSWWDEDIPPMPVDT